MNTSRGYAPVENGELYYEAVGEGPAVLLMHAAVADHTMWEPQIEALSQSHRVIRYDLRGHGRSRTQETSFSNRQDVRDLLTHLGVERAVLVGNSRGGIIALDTALEFPDLVSGVVWVCGGVSGYDTDAPPNEIEWFERLEALWEAKEWETLSSLEAHVWGDGIGQPEGRAPSHIVDKLREMILADYMRQTTEPTPRPLEPRAAGRLGELSCPLLIIIGDLDTSGTRASAEYLAQQVPHARKVVFHNVAHMASMERPDEFNRLVLDFLGEHGL